MDLANLGYVARGVEAAHGSENPWPAFSWPKTTA